MIDPRTPVSDNERLAYELKAITDRLDTLERPTGTSLYQTVDRLQASIAQTIQPEPIYRLDSPAAITSAASDLASVSVPVPVGYTRALVNVTATATLLSSQAAGTWALLMVSAIISPAPGAAFYNQWASIDGQKYGGASASSTVVLEGLEHGDSVDVAARVSFPGTYKLPRASVAGSILFLR